MADESDTMNGSNGLGNLSELIVEQSKAIGTLTGECRSINQRLESVEHAVNKRLDSVECEQRLNTEHWHQVGQEQAAMGVRMAQSERSISSLYRTVNDNDELTPPPAPTPITQEAVMTAHRQMADEVTERVRMQIMEREMAERKEAEARNHPIEVLPSPKTWRDHMQITAVFLGLVITVAAIGSWLFRGGVSLDPDTVAVMKQIAAQQRGAVTSNLNRRDAGQR